MTILQSRLFSINLPCVPSQVSGKIQRASNCLGPSHITYLIIVLLSKVASITTKISVLLALNDESPLKVTRYNGRDRYVFIYFIFIDGNKIPQSNWVANSLVSGTGPNGNYASTLTDPVTYKTFTGGAPTKDCELFPFAYDLNSDGKIDAVDMTVIEDQYGTKGIGLPADLNKDNAIDGIDLNIILSYIKNNQ